MFASYNPARRCASAAVVLACAVATTAHAQPKPVALEHNDWVDAVAFSPDGKLLATAGSHAIRLWDVGSGKEVAGLKHSGGIVAMAFRPDGKVIVATGNGGTVRLLDVATRKEVGTVEAHKTATCAVGFTPDGKYMVTGGYDNLARV